MMRHNNTSSAYDFGSIEQMELGSAETKKNKPAVQDKTVKNAKSSAFMKYLCMGVIVGSVCSLILYNEVKMTELSDQTANLKSQLSKQQTEQVRMEAKQESLYNSAAVEQYAQNNLNMIKLEKNNVEYIQLESHDKIVRNVSQKEQGSYFMRGMTNCFGRIVEYLS